MERSLFSKLEEAKRQSSIEALEKLYKDNHNNLIIKFEYARRLKKINLNLAKKLFLELLGTSNEKYALLELGIIERCFGNYDKAKEYFNKILNSSNTPIEDKNCAMLELGKIEVKMGNINKSYSIFKELIGTSNECYALLELGKLEIKMGNNAKAIEYLKRILNSKCGYYAMFFLGRIELLEGNDLNAMLYFNELLNTPLRRMASNEIKNIRIKQLEDERLFKEKIMR